MVLSRNKRRITFPFWNSFNDAQENKLPTAYDILACISSEICCPETFEDFCGEFGYDTDSRNAEATFKRCSAFSKKLQKFFVNEEMVADLRQIN